jgi:alpha-amylase/alpha-mannosidase (GH57 family)
MTNYLNRLDEMGLVHVRVIVPTATAPRLVELADSARSAYLGAIADAAGEDDPRLYHLAQGNLVQRMTATEQVTVFTSLPPKQRGAFEIIKAGLDETYEQMQRHKAAYDDLLAQSNSADEKKKHALFRKALRERAKAVVCGIQYKSKRTVMENLK